jgi:2-oxo-4-hydroxy-4-carboxy-5-ureidoimidazoline decarboxylase
MPNLAELNALPREEFTRSCASRPFANREALHTTLCDTVRHAKPDEQLALIRAHPDLVGRAVLTSESQGEQASAGLGDLTPEEVAQFDRYNTEYKDRFGFPFVICARLNKKEAILRAFPERLQNSCEKEIETALGEIYKIADLRLRDLLQ